MRFLALLLSLALPFSLLTAPGSITANTFNPCFKNCHADSALYVLLRSEEGFSPFIYKDSAGVETICNGHVVQKWEHFGQPLTGEQCEVILQEDVGKTEQVVNDLVTVPLYQNQHNSLTSFAFNVGTGALKKSTLLKKVNAKQHIEVPPQIMRYVYAGGKKQYGLVIRRRLEASLYKRVP